MLSEEHLNAVILIIIHFIHCRNVIPDILHVMWHLLIIINIIIASNDKKVPATASSYYF